MLMADTMAIFFSVLGMMLAFPGLWLLCRGLWPDTVAAAATRCNSGLTTPFFVGLPITAGVLLTAVALGNLAGTVGKIGAAAIICVYMVYAHTGVSGLATLVGRRLSSPADAERPWKATLRGGIALELSYLLPILGWFVILPASIITGCGASTLSLFQRRRLPSPAAVAPIKLDSPAPARGEGTGVGTEGPVGVPR